MDIFDKIISENKQAEKQNENQVKENTNQQDENQKSFIEKIIENVASYFSINVTDITGKSKQKRFALPRQIAMYLCKNLTDLNFTMIARILGNRDRTTIMYAVDKIALAIKEEPNLKRDIDNITKNINSI